MKNCQMVRGMTKAITVNFDGLVWCTNAYLKIKIKNFGGDTFYIDVAFVRVDNGLRGISEGKIAELYEDQ